MGVRRMQGKWTVHVFFGLLGSTLGGLGSQGPDKCSMQCAQVYSLHTAQYEQVLPSLEACQQGCQFFSEIETKNGFQDALSNWRLATIVARSRPRVCWCPPVSP